MRPAAASTPDTAVGASTGGSRFPRHGLRRWLRALVLLISLVCAAVAVLVAWRLLGQRLSGLVLVDDLLRSGSAFVVAAPLARPSDLLGADGIALLIAVLGMGGGAWAAGDVLGERRARRRARRLSQAPGSPMAPILYTEAAHAADAASLDGLDREAPAPGTAPRTEHAAGADLADQMRGETPDAETTVSDASAAATVLDDSARAEATQAAEPASPPDREPDADQRTTGAAAFVPRVFVSHSGRDTAFGERLVQDLRVALGGSDAVWFDAAPDPEHDDRGGLAAGDPFPSEIIHQLTSRNVFIVILSPDAARSRWVDFEIAQAVDRYLSPSRKIAVILPVRYRRVPMPDLVKIFQYVDMEAEEQVVAGAPAYVVPEERYAAGMRELIAQIRTGESRRVQREGEPPFDDDRLPIPDHLVGREEEVRWALERLRPGQVAAVTAFNGLGGIGKTTLAALAVRELMRARRFADGIAVVDCRDQRDPATILRHVLGRFDPRREEPPEDTSLNRLRDLAHVLLNGKQALVVLDNVEPDWHIEQVVEPLRAAGLALLLTSRQMLPLAVAPVEASLTLPLLSAQEALDLFAQSYGRAGARDLTPEERANAVRIVTYLGRHTLAVKLAGGYLAKQSRSLGAYADGLEADPRRALILRDGQEAVNLVLASSYAALPEPARRAFVALALFATADIGRYAAIAAAATDQSDPESSEPFAAEQAVDELVTRRLVDPLTIETMPAESDRERIRLHPLVRAFAELKLTAWPAAERDATSLAIARYYASYVGETSNTAFAPDEANIAGAIEWAHANKQDQLVAELSDGMREYWQAYSRTAQRVRYLPWGVEASERLVQTSGETADRAQLARMLLANADLHLYMGHLTLAESTAARSLALRREMGDRRAEGVALSKLGDILLQRGDLAGAEQHYEQCRQMMYEVGDRRAEGIALSKLGQVAQLRGRLAEAEGYYQQSLAIRREVQDRQGEGVVLYNLASIAEERDDLDRAEALHRESLAIGIEVQSGPDIADSLLELGRYLVERRDRREEGCSMLREAATLYAQMGIEDREAEARRRLRELGCEA